MKHDGFQSRHIGPDTLERDEMLKVVGASSLDALMDEVIPASIRLAAPLDLPAGQTESEYLRNLRQLAAQNQIFRSFIGLGYYDCITPSVIIRNVLENPGWCTPIYPLPSRGFTGTPRRSSEFSDNGTRPDGHGHRQCFVAR